MTEQATTRPAVINLTPAQKRHLRELNAQAANANADLNRFATYLFDEYDIDTNDPAWKIDINKGLFERATPPVPPKE